MNSCNSLGLLGWHPSHQLTIGVLVGAETDSEVRSFPRGVFHCVLRSNIGKPNAPTIFNVVVGVVVCNWLNWVCGRRMKEQGLGMYIGQKGIIFYADGGLLSARGGGWLQDRFDNLVG